MQIGLVGETGVVQAAVFKVTVLKVDFASGQQLAEVNYLLLQVTVQKVDALLVSQYGHSAQVEVVYCDDWKVFLDSDQFLKLKLRESLSTHLYFVLQALHLVELRLF